MSNVIVHVYRPELTPEEYEKRMAKIKAAAAELLIAAYKQKEKKGVA